MSDSATRLGRTLALFTNYGRQTVLDAMVACSRGEATPQQQRIVAQLVDALV